MFLRSTDVYACPTAAYINDFFSVNPASQTLWALSELSILRDALIGAAMEIMRNLGERCHFLYITMLAPEVLVSSGRCGTGFMKGDCEGMFEFFTWLGNPLVKQQGDMETTLRQPGNCGAGTEEELKARWALKVKRFMTWMRACGTKEDRVGTLTDSLIQCQTLTEVGNLKDALVAWNNTLTRLPTSTTQARVHFKEAGEALARGEVGVLDDKQVYSLGCIRHSVDADATDGDKLARKWQM
jgi:hypothetical protein